MLMTTWNTRVQWQELELKRKREFECTKIAERWVQEKKILNAWLWFVSKMLDAFPVFLQKKIPVNWPDSLNMLILARFCISVKASPVKTLETSCVWLTYALKHKNFYMVCWKSSSSPKAFDGAEGPEWVTHCLFC